MHPNNTYVKPEAKGKVCSFSRYSLNHFDVLLGQSEEIS